MSDFSIAYILVLVSLDFEYGRESNSSDHCDPQCCVMIYEYKCFWSPCGMKEQSKKSKIRQESNIRHL